MAKLAESKLTSQGQVSVPAAVRARLGLVPGGTIEWNALDSGEVVVRKVAPESFETIRARFAHLRPKRPVTEQQMKDAVAKYIGARHKRRTRNDKK